MFARKRRNEGKNRLQSLNPSAGISLGGDLVVHVAKMRVKNESDCVGRLLGSVGTDVLVLRIRLSWHAVCETERKRDGRRGGGMT